MPIDHSAIQTRIMRALNEQNLDEWETLVTEDYSEEYPQSGEIIRGRKNVRAAIENYPGGLLKDGLDVSTTRLAATEARWVKSRPSRWCASRGAGTWAPWRSRFDIPTGPCGGPSFFTSCVATRSRRTRRSSLPRSRRRTGASRMSTRADGEGKSADVS